MKTILAIFALLFVTGAFAQPAQCEQSKRADYKANCYVTMLDIEQRMLKRNIDELKKVAPTKQFGEIMRDQRLWEMDINNGCTTDNVCKSTSMYRRNEYLRETIDSIKRKK